MIQAYIVYTLLFVFLLISSWLCSKSTDVNKQIIMFVSVFICSIILGLRYNVGVDFLAYEYIYQHQFFDDVESGFAFINKILFSLGLPSSYLFTIVAFFQLFLFAKGVENIGSRYLPLAFFFYFTTLYFFLSLNVLRQTITFSIFVFSIKYVVDKQFIKYVITILLASTIHKSALSLLPIYFLINTDCILRHRIIQLIGYVTTYAMALFLSEYIWSLFEPLALYSGYAEYADSIDSFSEIEWGKDGGLGVYLWMIIDLWVILFYSKFQECSPSKHAIALYNLYYIGLLLSNVIAGSYFDRVNIYFHNFRILVYAIFFYSIFKGVSNKLYKIMAIAVLLVLIVFFYMGIHNKASQCAPFQFVSF